MPRYIDAEKLKAHYSWWECTESGNEQKKVFDTIIDLQPTADVVEVVRCKGCKYYNLQHHYCEGIGNWFGFEDEWSDNGFCYKGERRDDGKVH